MKRIEMLFEHLAVGFAFLILALIPVTSLAQLDTTFTYQGSLSDDGVNADALYDFEFELWSQSSGGSQIGLTEVLGDVAVADGIFSVPLDFGDFNSDVTWLEIRIRAGASGGAYTTLSPRTQVTIAPQASYADYAGVAGEAGPWSTNGSVAYYADGNVGIGTSTPDQKLSVHTSSGISYIRVSDNTTGPTSGLRMGLLSGNAYIINDESSKSLSLGSSGTTQVRISDIGRVGINEFTPDQMLHVTQDSANKGLRIQHQSTTDYWENGIGTTTKNYKFYYNDSIKADISSVDGAFAPTSDRRFKRDIADLGLVLPKVRQLQPSTYQYIGNSEDSPRSIGFIAQDVQPLFPDLVRTIDEGDKLGLVYDGFAVISIQAIKEMADRLDAMQQEIDDLKTRIQNR